jgi:hypothetical protein
MQSLNLAGKMTISACGNFSDNSTGSNSDRL